MKRMDGIVAGKKEIETEVKFYLADLPGLEKRLVECGARLIQPRGHEVNLRFDTAEGDLVARRQVLRLRKDRAAIVTFKGPPHKDVDVNVRQEIEFEVSNFDSAQHLFEALGYQVVVIYEKFRATYSLDGMEITLDQMPYGDFAEIEGPSAEEIRSIAEKLELNWSRRVVKSYIALFDRLRDEKGWEIRDLTFANFESLPTAPADLHVLPADKG